MIPYSEKQNQIVLLCFIWKNGDAFHKYAEKTANSFAPETAECSIDEVNWFQWEEHKLDCLIEQSMTSIWLRVEVCGGTEYEPNWNKTVWLVELLGGIH